jgi:hypothetical protein
LSHSSEASFTLGIIGDGTTLHQETQKQLEVVFGDHFSCRAVDPTDTSVDVLVVVGKYLPVQPIKIALLAGFPPTRIVTVIENLRDLQDVCLTDLGIPSVIPDSRGHSGPSLVSYVRAGLSHLAAPPLARSRVEETLGQLDMQQSETFRGLAFKQQLSDLDVNPPEDSGLCISVIPGKKREYPVFGSCAQGGDNVAIVYGTEEGLNGLNAREHALFTQALVCRCLGDNEADASLVDRFIEEAHSMLGRKERFRPTLLVFRRSLQTLEVLLTGDLDLWIINPKRLPPLGITQGPGVALSGAENSPHGKTRRIKLTSGDHLLVLPSRWFADNEANAGAMKKPLLEAATAGELADFLKLTGPHDSGTAIVVTLR